MKVIHCHTPLDSTSTSLIRVTFPAKGSGYQPIDLPTIYFKSGKASKLNNRSCTHVKVVSADFPLVSPTYGVTLSVSTTYRNMPLLVKFPSTSSIRHTMFMFNLPRTFIRQLKISGGVIDEYVQTVDMEEGTCTVIHDYIYSFDDGRELDLSTRTTTHFLQTTAGKSTVVITRKSFRMIQGSWVETNSSLITSYGSSIRDCITVDAPILAGYWHLYRDKLMHMITSDPCIKTFGQLANDCVTSGGKHVATNSAQYLLELNQLASILGPFKALLGGVWTGKALASAWLSYNYGAKLAAKETYDLVSGIVRSRSLKVMDYDILRSRSNFNSIHPNGIQYTGYRALTVYYRVFPHWLIKSYVALRKWGLNPSLSLAWDLVPLSFVVDWFLPIGDALAHVDSSSFVDSLDIIESLSTTKVYFSIPASSLLGPDAYGHFTICYYARRLTGSAMPKPEFKFDSLSLSGMNAVNGAALLIQRR